MEIAVAYFANHNRIRKGQVEETDTHQRRRAPEEGATQDPYKNLDNLSIIANPKYDL